MRCRSQPLEVLRTYMKGNFTLDLDKAATQALWDECQKSEDEIERLAKENERLMATLLSDDDHLVYHLADGILATLGVSCRTVVARDILKDIDDWTNDKES